MASFAEHDTNHSIRARIDASLDNVLSGVGSTPWALLDFPAHTNVGDSAIWQGTLALLEKRLGREPDFLTSARQFPVNLHKHVPTGPLFLLGGGNFGDLWNGHWEHRVRILKHFSDRRIIQLPQSIHFKEPHGTAVEETRRAIGRHPNFTFMVRDQASLDFATTHFDCNTILCPDFAYGLTDLGANQRPKFPISALLRTDAERCEQNFTGSAEFDNIPKFDWVHAPKPKLPIRLVEKSTRVAPVLLGSLAGLLNKAYRVWSENNLKRGLEQLSISDVVITDRLHGHILCYLLGKPHVVLDNVYGKNFGYMETWPESPLAMRATHIDQALLIAQELADNLCSQNQDVQN